jgi:hypothetical protein
MGLKTALLIIDRNSLPQKRSDLGVRFECHTVAKIKASSPATDMVLIKPAGDLLTGENAVGPEPRWNHILCGIRLKAMDGTDAQGSGQLIITGQRLIGMIDTGKVTGARPLDLDTSGNVFCFALHRGDVYSPQMKKHRLTPSEFLFRSKEEQNTAFHLVIFSALVYVANGKMGYWHDKNMLHAISEEGREGLLKS